MKTTEKQQAHQKCIELLESIHYFERKIQYAERNLNGFGGTFPSLALKYERSIEISNACIKRLSERYMKQCNFIHFNIPVNES